ncbi:MAG TPA: DUF5723 family protein, partial [Phnomibacter sp.]|nr:DUF5723 family protein [Phnomibacter sp.]
MRTSSLLLLFLLVTALAKSQDYAGFNTGNYTGVHAAFFNPAGIADSRYRWDVNLFSVSTLVLNNQADFSIKDFSTGFDTKKLENKLLGNNSLPTSALVSADFHGPSFMFNAGKKTSIALTSRVRVMSRLSNLEGKLWGELLNSAEDTQYPFTVNSSQNQRIAIHGWSEFGLTWGQVLLQQHKHFLKGGITGKFLGGAAASGIQLDNIRATIAEDADLEAYLTNTSGRFGMALAGVSLDDFEVQELLKFKN